MDAEEWERRTMRIHERLDEAEHQLAELVLDVRQTIQDHDHLSMRLAELERGVAAALAR